MSDIDLLRYALACIWTELENDWPSEDDCRRICDEALEATKHATRPKVLSGHNGTGLDAWLARDNER